MRHNETNPTNTMQMFHMRHATGAIIRTLTSHVYGWEVSTIGLCLIINSQVNFSHYFVKSIMINIMNSNNRTTVLNVVCLEVHHKTRPELMYKSTMLSNCYIRTHMTHWLLRDVVIVCNNCNKSNLQTYLKENVNEQFIWNCRKAITTHC